MPSRRFRDLDGNYVQVPDTDSAVVEHAHAGSDITSGTVADARIPSTIARDSETTAAVSAAVAALVNSAPSTLDTLKELSDALGADANFATTVTNALAGKLAVPAGSNDDILQKKAGVWGPRTLAQLLTDLTSGINTLIAADHKTITIGIPFVIDGAGSAISAGVKGYLPIPFACTITGWTLVADVSGSIVVDVWKDTYANYPPTVGDTIWGGSKPTLSSAQKNTATGLSIAVAAGDILGFNADATPATVTNVTLVLIATRTV